MTDKEAIMDIGIKTEDIDFPELNLRDDIPSPLPTSRPMNPETESDPPPGEGCSVFGQQDAVVPQSVCEAPPPRLRRGTCANLKSHERPWEVLCQRGQPVNLNPLKFAMGQSGNCSHWRTDLVEDPMWDRSLAPTLLSKAHLAHLVGDTGARTMIFSCFKKCRDSSPQDSQAAYLALVWEQWVRFCARCWSLERVSQRSSRPSLSSTGQGENELVQNVDEPCRIEGIEGNQEEVLMNQLVRVLFGQNPDWGSTFRSISSGFTTTQQVLELLLPSALLSIVGTWMHQSSQALPHPLGLVILQLLLPYLQHCMGSLNVEHEAHPLLALPEDVHAGQAERPESSHGAALVPSEVAVPSPGVQLTSSLSEVSTRSSPLPLYNQRGGDTCSIHVHLENQRRTEYKRIVVTCQDRAPAIIRRALDEHLLNEEDPQDFELLQVVSEHKKLRIPDDGNVFQAINPHGNFNFIVRRKLTRKCAQVKRKEFLESSCAVRATTPPAMSSSSSAAARALHVPRNNRVTNSSSSPPNDLQGSRFILVRLEEQSRGASKRVLVTCREKVLDIVCRALEQHSLEDEDPEDFELLRKVSAHETIQLPEHATIMFCMYPEVKYYFILRRRPISERTKVKGKEFSESTPKASAMASNISPGSNSISSENIPPKSMATKRKKSSVIRRLLARSSRPQYNKQVGDSCLIRVRLEQQSEEHCRTVLVTCNDRAPVVIRRALEELLIPGNPEDYELGQIISPQQKLRIPHSANVFYGMNPRVRYDFLLRKRTYPNEEVDDWIDPKPPTYEAMEVQGRHWKLLRRICCCLSGQC